SLQHRLSWRMTCRSSDGAAFLEQAENKLRAARGVADIANAGAHQTSGACGSSDKNPLLPHFLQNLSARSRIEACCFHERCDGLHAVRHRAVPFPEGNVMRLVEVADLAFCSNSNGNQALPAKHSGSAESVVENI